VSLLLFYIGKFVTELYIRTAVYMPFHAVFKKLLASCHVEKETTDERYTHDTAGGLNL